MATIVTRETTQTDGTSPKGSPLTNAEVDTNFINLNDDKVEVSGAIIFQAKAGEALAKGDVVYVSGVSGNTPVVSKADADDANKMPAYGLAEDAASLNAAVNVVTFGTLYDLNTSGFSAGDTVYVSTTAGALTNSAPTGESSLIQNIGMVVRSHASAGSIKVGGAGRTNATPNLNDGNVFIGNASNQAAARALTTSDIASGTFADARIAQSNVTQHQAALSITESQISDLQAYLTAESDTLDSVTGRGATTTNAVTVGNLTSTGIDDNATSTAITIDSSQNVGIGTTNATPSNGEGMCISASSTIARIDMRNSTTGDVTGDGTSLQLNGNNFTIENREAGYVAIATSLTERMRIDSSGNVGIGTASPAAKLDVNVTAVTPSDSTFSGALIGQNSGTMSVGTAVGLGFVIRNTAGGFVGGNGLGGGIYCVQATTGVNEGELTFHTRASSSSFPERMRIDSSGNVGIGRAPSTALNAFNYTVFEVAGKATNRSGALVLSTSNGTTYGQIYADDSVGLNFVNSQSGKSTVFYGSSGEHLRIDSSGRVGIGSSDPSSGTSTYYDDLVIKNATSGSGAGITIQSNTTNGFGAIDFRKADGTQVGKMYASSAGGQLGFETGGAERMRIDSSGNVGIGTTSPSAELHIINSTPKIRLQSSGAGTDNTLSFISRNISNVAAYADIIGLGAGHNSTNAPILFTQGSGQTERMRIDTSGKLLVGTTSNPDGRFTIATNPAAGYGAEIGRISMGRQGSGYPHIGYNAGPTGTNGLVNKYIADKSSWIHFSNGSIIFNYDTGSTAAGAIAGSESMRIDSSGRVFIGKTSDNDNTAGHTLHSSGLAVHTRDSSFAAIFNRTTNDGDIAQFKKDGALVGSIGSNTSGGSPLLDINAATSGTSLMRFTTSGTERMRLDASGNVGIGAATPPSQLAGTSGLVIEKTTPGFALAGGSRTFLQYVTGTTWRLYDKTAGLDRVVIDSAGNLGLGNTSPASYGGGFVVDDLGINILTASSNSPGTNKLSWWSDSNGISQNAYISVVNDGATTNTGEMVFYTKSAGGTLQENMRIKANSYITMGTTGTTIDTSNFGTVFAGTSAPGYMASYRNVPGTGVAVLFGGNAGQVYIRGDGDLENTNNSYGAISDERLKSNIVDASSQIDDIMAVQVRSYTLNETGATHIGVVAQELEASGMSGLVKTDDEGMKAVKYSVLYMKAIKALQEAVTRIETLEAEVAALKGA